MLSPYAADHRRRRALPADRHAEDGRRGGRRLEDPRGPDRQALVAVPQRAVAARPAGDPDAADRALLRALQGPRARQVGARGQLGRGRGSASARSSSRSSATSRRAPSRISKRWPTSRCRRPGRGPRDPSTRLLAVAPALFVVLWSTGFIAAKFGLPYAPPFTFLLYRFALVAALMAVVCARDRARWPRSAAITCDVAIAALAGPRRLPRRRVRRDVARHVGGHGRDAGRAAADRHRVSRARCGCASASSRVNGSALRSGSSASGSSSGTRSRFDSDLVALTAIVAALVGISVGTLYQKRHCVARRPAQRRGDPVRGVRARLPAARAAVRIAGATCSGRRRSSSRSSWSVLVLSVGAISLLYWLLRHGAASERRAPVLPRAAGHRADGVGAVRREARRARARRDGADRDRRRALASAAVNATSRWH